MLVHSSRHVRRAFTLIELLVVIAIIAILAAILFPVFNAVREQARQSNTMSNMHSVYLGARLFNEDEGQFPPSLFGYAEIPLTQYRPTDPPSEPALPTDASTDSSGNMTVGTPMDKVTEKFSTGLGVNNGYLYGEQVKDFNTFLCSDNLINNQNNGKNQVTEVYYPLSLTNGNFVKVTWQASNPNASPCQTYGDVDLPARQTADSASTPPTYDTTVYSNNGANNIPKLYYKMDSMDIGPMLDQNGNWLPDPNNPNLKAYELHYSPDWTHQLYQVPSANVPEGCDTFGSFLNANNTNPITEQLKYKNPPTENTILTWNTQHAATTGTPSVIIMLLSGTARKISYKQALNELPLQYR